VFYHFYPEFHRKLCLLTHVHNFFLSEQDPLVSLFTSLLLCSASPALTCSSMLVEREKKEETSQEIISLLTWDCKTEGAFWHCVRLILQQIAYHSSKYLLFTAATIFFSVCALSGLRVFISYFIYTLLSDAIEMAEVSPPPTSAAVQYA